MAGVFTDSQADFSWLEPGEEKRFTQYFMPYSKIGMVKNASREDEDPSHGVAREILRDLESGWEF